MVKIVEWKITDKNNPDKVYNEVADFFKDGTDSEELVKQHLDIEVDLLEDKISELSADGKFISHYKIFSNNDNYEEWKEKKEALAPIDGHLNFELQQE